MYLRIVFILISFAYSDAGYLYPNYNITVDPRKVLEWTDDRALSYISTVRLSDYDHHIFQYRNYPCQYFYTDEIQLHHSEDETLKQCSYNSLTNEYEYNFQLNFDSRHVEPFILRNLAIKCSYINCSLTLLNLTYIYIGWNFQGRQLNPNCSFNVSQPYYINRTPYALTDWIPLRCKSLSACESGKLSVQQSLSSHIQLIYGSSYELEQPYCSLDRNVAHLIETNLVKTNQLLRKVVNLLERRFRENDKSQ